MISRQITTFSDCSATLNVLRDRFSLDAPPNIASLTADDEVVTQSQLYIGQRLRNNLEPC